MTSTAPAVVLRTAGSHKRTLSHDIVAAGFKFQPSRAAGCYLTAVAAGDRFGSPTEPSLRSGPNRVSAPSLKTT